MWTQALMILGGAVLSSVLTLALAYYFFEHRYKQRLLKEIDQLADAQRQRFKEVLDEEVEKAGETIETRVRQGVLDAVASLPTSEVIQETTQSVVRTGVDLVEAGLSTFLGKKPRKG